MPKKPRNDEPIELNIPADLMPSAEEPSEADKADVLERLGLTELFAEIVREKEAGL